MKTILGFVFIVYLSASLAQITFTREWVKGKRSAAGNNIMLPKDGHTLCRNLVSAVEYLIELERVRKAECAECCHGAAPPMSILPDIQRSPADYLSFLRDIPQTDSEQIGTNSDRRPH